MKEKTKQIPLPLKGKAIVLQSGGCTAVINQSLAGVIQAAKKTRAITDLWGSECGITGILSGNFFDLKAETAASLSALEKLPSAALGSARYQLKPSDEGEIISRLKKWDVRYLFLIGGNDTSETALRIAAAADRENHELRVIHIPKTIDNDLVETDHTPGYGSVARFAAITTQEAALDTKAIRQADPVKIIELMGRNSGWIVAASALLQKSEIDPPHILLFPEVPFAQEDFLKKVEFTLKKSGYCVAVISETIRDGNGNRLGARKEGVTADAFGHQYVEGAAAYLARIVEDSFKVRARFDKPGTVQRMSMAYVSPVDQKEAYQAGMKALEWAVQGLSRVMVSFVREKGKHYKIRYEPVPLDQIPGKEKYLPAAFMNSTKDGISQEFVKYALPLVGSGLPDFADLKKIRPRI
jgi:6-phosphofructokinase 1